MDFGTGQEIAQAMHAGVVPGYLVGTPAYVAPEVLNGAPSTPQSDIYGLGVLLFYLLTGTYPVVSSNVPELHDAHSQGARRSLREARPDLPPSFSAIVDRALLPQPGDRFQRADELEVALSRWTAEGREKSPIVRAVGAACANRDPTCPTVHRCGRSRSRCGARGPIPRFWSIRSVDRQIDPVAACAACFARGGRSGGCRCACDRGRDRLVSRAFVQRVQQRTCRLDRRR